MSKMNDFRKVNAVVWFVIAVVLMICVYNAWSQYGPYTIFSFFASLVVHGGICLVCAVLIDEQIVKYFKNK